MIWVSPAINDATRVEASGICLNVTPSTFDPTDLPDPDPTPEPDPAPEPDPEPEPDPDDEPTVDDDPPPGDDPVLVGDVLATPETLPGGPGFLRASSELPKVSASRQVGLGAERNSLSALQQASLLDAALWEALDALGLQMRDSGANSDDGFDLSIMEGSTVVLMAGFLSWFFRAGSLISSLLGTLPLWSRFDPLPVLARSDKEREEESKKKKQEAEQDERELGHILDTSRPTHTQAPQKTKRR